MRAVNQCRKARPAEPTSTRTATTATSRKHQSLRWLREYHLISQWTVSIMSKSDARSMYANFTYASFVTNSHQLLTASFAPRDVRLCSSVAPMSGGSSSDWWDGWEWRGECANSQFPDPKPTEQASDEQVMNAVHKLQDRQQQILALTKSRSHKTGKERATTVSKGNDAYAHMEAVISAREWQAEARRAYDQKFAEAAEAEETCHDGIRRTLEKTEALEKHVKTVTMRSGSLAFNETDFFQTLIERQEETIRDLNTLYGKLCQSRTTQW